ncbi:DUF429 domain-containing protein [Longivirga aurantiaca]|uniref:DUF429 domain-containing protein n=1 Tax=Longivirga aurantiaca TaxID=1837743 RepID=A0ABW1T0I6_9ACTN
MRSLGLDLAADPVNTALCAIDWATGEIQVAVGPVTDEHIVGAVGDSDVLGVDAPLGWPQDFVEAITSHHELGAWRFPEADSPAARRSLRFRATDLALMAEGHRPLSVASDLIGVVALRAARLQHLLAANGREVDRTGTTGHLVETYPAAALSSWGLRSTSYKGAKNRDALAGIAALMVESVGPVLPGAADVLRGRSDHVVDAFVCALVAAAARVGLTQPPHRDQWELARTEGWIHVPTATAGDVARAASRQLAS